MRTALRILTLGVIAAVASLTVATATGADTTATLSFNDAAGNVTLTIPTPSCHTFPDGVTSCQWELFVDEPDVPGQPAQPVATGPDGVLSVQYPADFCGTIQADEGLVVFDPTTGTQSFRKLDGRQHTVSTCSTPPTTPTTVGCPPDGTPPPCTTTPTTSTPCPPSGRPAFANCPRQPPPPPTTGPPAQSPPAPPSAPVVPTAAPSAPAPPAPATAVSPTPTGQLAYTGVPIGVWWLLAIGSAGVLSGLALLRTRRVRA